MEVNSQKLFMFFAACRKLYRLSLTVGLVIVLSLTQPMQVTADDTEDLFNIYGLTLGKPIKSELELEIAEIESDIKSMQTQETLNEEYNAILEKYIAKREEDFNTVLNDISIYQNQNSSIVSRINDELLTADISELLQLDGQYKSNVHNMNSLLTVINNYNIDYVYKETGKDLSDIEKLLEDKKTLWIESMDTFNLGDVKDIKWILPNDRRINSDYGYRIDPINYGEVRFHTGTDYYATTGTPIGALFNGVVLSCGWSDTIGNFVTIQSGENVKYLVCHCSKINVVEGQEVSQYDVIAYVGGTGTRCTGPHLHLSLYLNGVTYDVDKLFQ